MKKRNIVVFGVVLLLTFLVTFWWQYQQRVIAVLPLPEAKSATLINTPTAAPTSDSPAATTSVAAERPNKRVAMASLLGKLNHKPIELYGKVVDQHGEPLADVEVYASVIYNTGLSSGVDQGETKTDASGLFSIKGMKGRTLGIGLAKGGYKYGGDHGPFQFSDLEEPAKQYHPDANKPVVFVMHKLQGAEPMLHFGSLDFRIQSDGTPVRINLMTGKRVSSGGDLVITLKHPKAEKGQQRLEHYPWTAQFIAAGGGFIESTSKLMYLAPEDSYVENLVLGVTGQEPKDYNPGKFRVGQMQAYKQYYLKLGNGCYARVIVEVLADTSPLCDSFVSLHWWLNPKPGSRNLEYDPAKTPTP